MYDRHGAVGAVEQSARHWQEVPGTVGRFGGAVGFHLQVCPTVGDCGVGWQQMPGPAVPQWAPGSLHWEGANKTEGATDTDGFEEGAEDTDVFEEGAEDGFKDTDGLLDDGRNLQR